MENQKDLLLKNENRESDCLNQLQNNRKIIPIPSDVEENPNNESVEPEINKKLFKESTYRLVYLSIQFLYMKLCLKLNLLD